MISAAQSAELDATIDTLEARYAQALTAHRETWYFPGLGTGTQAETLWLPTVRKQIDFLKGDMRTDVLAGRRSYAEWADLAQSANALLKNILGSIGDLSFSAVGGKVAEGIKDAAAFAVFGTSTILLLLGALVLYTQTRGRS